MKNVVNFVAECRRHSATFGARRKTDFIEFHHTTEKTVFKEKKKEERGVGERVGVYLPYKLFQYSANFAQFSGKYEEKKKKEFFWNFNGCFFFTNIIPQKFYLKF